GIAYFGTSPAPISYLLTTKACVDMSTSRQVLPGVLAADGTVECPDCGTIVQCGKVGISNLEKRHRGSEVCKKTAFKRSKNSQKKNTSILGFLIPKPVKTPSLVQIPPLLGQSSEIETRTPIEEHIPKSPQHDDFFDQLRLLVSRLPESVPEALLTDGLAEFSGDPAIAVDPALSGDVIWEEMLNQMLKRHLGYGKTSDLTAIIRRGELGMDGFIRFMEYFVIERGVSADLIKQKLEHLMETIQRLVEPHTSSESSSQPDLPHVQAIESDNEVEIIKVSHPSNNRIQITDVQLRKCQGYELLIPEGRSPHLCYPFGLHAHTTLPWDYSIINGAMVLRASSCTLQREQTSRNCRACRSLEENTVLKGIINRMNDGIHENTPRPYYSLLHAFELLDRKNAQIDYLRLRGLNQARRLIGQAAALADHKRFLIAMGSGKHERVERLVSIALRQRRGIRGILGLYDAAARQVYKPKSYSEEDDMRGILLWRLGGPRMVQIGHKALGLPSLTTLRHRSLMIPIIPSAGPPRVLEIQKNVEATFESVQELLEEPRIVHQILMFDEIATEKRIRWDHRTNLFLGVCREHAKKVSLEFTTEDDMEEVFRAVDNGEIHAAAEATIGALGILSRNHRLYPARPILISGDCKRESGEEHAKLLQTTLDAVDSRKDLTNLRVVSVASDGETRRGTALVILTFKRKLTENSSIYDLVSVLPLMNLLVGDDDITADKDWKHVIKRLRNLVLRVRGIVIDLIRITPAIIKTHLRENGCSADHIRSLFNPEDQQDVKLAFDLLKDIWTLPLASEAQAPGFINARNALRTLGKLFYHIIFPYICVDLTLSEQIEHLSAAAHLALVLYHQEKKNFLPTLLYIDLMIMIKNAIFCVAKAKVDDPDGSFWLMLLGTDRLETLFGILRTMIGSDANVNLLQLVERITSTTEVANILAKYPHWDRGPRRLRLPGISRDSHELPDAADHIKPGSWRGNVSVKNVSIETSWKRGRRIIETAYPSYTPILAVVESCGGDILSPFGTLLVAATLDNDDVDESVAVAEDDVQYPLAIPDDRVEVEDAITEEDNNEESIRLSSRSAHKSFDRFIEVDGKTMSKARAISLRSKYNKITSSTDRLRRVQEIERYSRPPDGRIYTQSEFGDDLVIHDPIVTLASSEGHLWLCIAEINGFKFHSESVEQLSIASLGEPSVSISCQLLGLRPATTNDDPTQEYDWRTFTLPSERTFTISGALIQCVNPTMLSSDSSNSYYLFQSSSLLALATTIHQLMRAKDLRGIPAIPRSKDFPYRESSGKACFITEPNDNMDIGRDVLHICPRCSPEVPLDQKRPQQILAHIAAHIRHDSSIDVDSEPCGFCLRPSRLCRVYLTKGKGAKGNLRVDSKRSECPNFVSFKYQVAAQSTQSSPCSNVPLQCPLCLPSTPAVWRYNFSHHLETEHPNASKNLYTELWKISKSEVDEMRRIWEDRQKVTIKRVKKKGVAPIEVSEAHRARMVMSKHNDKSNEERSESDGENDTGDIEDDGDEKEKEFEDREDGAADEEDDEEDDDGDDNTLDNLDGYADAPVNNDFHRRMMEIESGDGAWNGWDPEEFDLRQSYVQDPVEHEIEAGTPPVVTPNAATSSRVRSPSIRETDHDLQNRYLDSEIRSLEPSHFTGQSEDEIGRESNRRSQRKRKAVEILEECICGRPVNTESDDRIQCKRAGCETIWYHLSCLGLELAAKNW
ncbi:hypothetical protein H0H93_002810, partial [Arthromyces matolae]